MSYLNFDNHLCYCGKSTPVEPPIQNDCSPLCTYEIDLSGGGTFFGFERDGIRYDFSNGCPINDPDLVEKIVSIWREATGYNLPASAVVVDTESGIVSFCAPSSPRANAIVSDEVVISEPNCNDAEPSTLWTILSKQNIGAYFAPNSGLGIIKTANVGDQGEWNNYFVYATCSPTQPVPTNDGEITVWLNVDTDTILAQNGAIASTTWNDPTCY